LCVVGDKLWWADQGTDQIGTCDKKDGSNWKVLRNSTSPMMHMKIYNETVQRGITIAGSFFSACAAFAFYQIAWQRKAKKIHSCPVKICFAACV